MTKNQIILRAQEDADRSGETLAVLNLNPYSPLYVIRNWRDAFEGHRELVAKITPKV
jgi:hypothetical protein